MKLWPTASDYSPNRLFCLDLLRGLDMFFLTVFAPFVNWYVFKVWTPPRWLHLLMNHSETAFAPTATGFGLFDFGQPLFLFVCGAAVPLALPKRLTPDGRPTFAYWKHVFYRVALLVFFGCLNRDLLKFDLGYFMPQSDTLWVIAAGYLAAALSILIRPRHIRFALPFVVLAVYWAIQQFGGDYTAEGNINLAVEKRIFGNLGCKLKWFAGAQKYAFALTTLGFATVSMLGARTMEILLSPRQPWAKAKILAAFGAALYAAGWVTSFWIPPVRHIYTTSFVLMTSGLSILFLDALYVITDIFRKRGGVGLFMIFGMFSLFAWETAVFFLRGVDKMAERFAEGIPVLIGTDAYQPVFIGLFEVLMVCSFVICRYRMSLAKDTPSREGDDS